MTPKVSEPRSGGGGASGKHTTDKGPGPSVCLVVSLCQSKSGLQTSRSPSCRSNPRRMYAASSSTPSRPTTLPLARQVCVCVCACACVRRRRAISDIKGSLPLQLFVPSSTDHHIHYYDLRRPREPLLVLKGHRKAVSYVRFLNRDELVSAYVVLFFACARRRTGGRNE